MNVKITGTKSILKALEGLPKELQRTTEFRALGSAGKVIRENIKSMAPVGDHGLLKESIGFNVKKSRKTKQLSVRIGPKSATSRTIGTYTKGKNIGKPKVIRPANYSHLVELGTPRTPANPFITKGAQASESEAMNALASGYEKGLDAAVKRLAKRNARK